MRAASVRRACGRGVWGRACVRVDKSAGMRALNTVSRAHACTCAHTSSRTRTHVHIRCTHAHTHARTHTTAQSHHLQAEITVEDDASITAAPLSGRAVGATNHFAFLLNNSSLPLASVSLAGGVTAGGSVVIVSAGSLSSAGQVYAEDDVFLGAGLSLLISDQLHAVRARVVVVHVCFCWWRCCRCW
jgi:hypothetical protein